MTRDQRGRVYALLDKCLGLEVRIRRQEVLLREAADLIAQRHSLNYNQDECFSDDCEEFPDWPCEPERLRRRIEEELP